MGVVGRVATLVALVTLGVVLSGKTLTLQSQSDLQTKWTKFIYLFSVAAAVGLADWHSFVFGIVAFKTLPRQMFGNLQAKLFPLYFQILVVLMSLALVSYSYLRTGKNSHAEELQVGILIGGLVMWVLNLVAFEPWTSAVMFERHKLEKQERTDGQDVKELPEYKALSKKFGMYHGISALSNLAALVCLHVHVWHAATTLISF